MDTYNFRPLTPEILETREILSHAPYTQWAPLKNKSLRKYTGIDYCDMPDGCKRSGVLVCKVDGTRHTDETLKQVRIIHQSARCEFAAAVALLLLLQLLALHDSLQIFLLTRAFLSLLCQGDTLLAVDGVCIADDGTMPFREMERLAFSHLISQRSDLGFRV